MLLNLPPLRLLLSSLFISALCIFPDGYHLSVVNIPQVILERFVNNSWYDSYGHALNNSQLSILWAVVANVYSIGGIFGAWSTMFLAERCGRKYTLLVINNVIAVISSILMGFSKMSNSWAMLTLGRLMIGYNSGLATSLTGMYLTECSPIQFRGLTACFVNLFITMTTLVAQIVALPELLGTEALWPLLLALAAVPATIQLATFWIFPESPKHLLLTAKNAVEARKSIMFYHGENADVETVFEEFRTEQKLAKEELNLKATLSNRDFLWPILMSAVVNIAQNATGIVAIFTYSTSIFQSVGIGERQASLSSMIVSIFNLTGAFIGLPLIERCGRRPLMLGGMITCLLCDCTFMVFSLWSHYGSGQIWVHYVCLVTIMVHVTVFNIGPGPIAWFISSESTPQSIRSIGASVSITANWTAALIFSLVFLPLQEAVGAWSFLLFILPSAACVVFLWLKMPETRNKTIEEIMKTWTKRSEGGRKESEDAISAISLGMEERYNDHVDESL